MNVICFEGHMAWNLELNEVSSIGEVNLGIMDGAEKIPKGYKSSTIIYIGKSSIAEVSNSNNNNNQKSYQPNEDGF